jgi:hypothetical protein
MQEPNLPGWLKIANPMIVALQRRFGFVMGTMRVLSVRSPPVRWGTLQRFHRSPGVLTNHNRCTERLGGEVSQKRWIGGGDRSPGRFGVFDPTE